MAVKQCSRQAVNTTAMTRSLKSGGGDAPRSEDWMGGGRLLCPRFPPHCSLAHRILTGKASLHRCLSGLAPLYFPAIVIVQQTWSLPAPSSSTSKLVVPSTRLSTFGDRAFTIAAACVWNGLPVTVTSAPSLQSSDPSRDGIVRKKLSSRRITVLFVASHTRFFACSSSNRIRAVE